jgi:hypothetical protein
MSEKHNSQPDPAQPDPNDGPFTPGPIEGMPFKRGSEEDLAIQRIIERGKRLRERAQ